MRWNDLLDAVIDTEGERIARARLDRLVRAVARRVVAEADRTGRQPWPDLAVFRVVKTKERETVVARPLGWQTYRVPARRVLKARAVRSAQRRIRQEGER